MDSALALVAALAASLFALDLWLDYGRRPRPHIAAYGIGMTMFAIATWAFFLGVTVGWTGPMCVFYLFGAILNIPFLASAPCSWSSAGARATSWPLPWAR